MRTGLLAVVPLLFAAPAPADSPRADSPPAAPRLPFSVLASHPHDPTAFTQGLELREGELLESTGLYAESSLRAVDPATGRVRTRAFLPADVFGEGVTAFGDSIYVLTWREHAAFVYGPDFLVRKKLPYDGEGWGLTHDATSLVMSDGTSTIRFLDPATFAVRRTIRVREAGRDVVDLNELEWAHGAIYANVWRQSRIVRIAPDTGEVTGVLDLARLDGGAPPGDPDAVLNGIAFDAKGDRFYVTGKRWSRLFEIKLR